MALRSRSFLAVLSLLTGLCGCGGSEKEPPPPPPGPQGFLTLTVQLSAPPAGGRFVPDTTARVRVTAQRKGADPVTATGVPNQTLRVSLAVGFYAVTVEALNAGGQVLAAKTTAGVEIRPNQTTTLTVQLEVVDVDAMAEHLLRGYTRLFLDNVGGNRSPLVPDRFTRFPDLASNDALLGYAIALIAAPRLGLLTEAQAHDRATTLIDWLRNRIARDQAGVLVHFSRTDTGEAAPGTEYSILTAAYTALAARLLGAAFGELADEAIAYHDSIDWCAYLSPAGRFYFSRGTDGKLHDEAGYYTDEFLVVFALARASSTHQPPEAIWQGLDYVPRDYASQAFGTLSLQAVTDDAAAFEVVLFEQFWDGSQTPAPINVRANAVQTLLAHRAYVTDELGLPVGLGRSPLYHRGDTYHLLGARPFGGTDHSRVEPALIGTMAAAAALPFERLDARIGASQDLAYLVNVPGLTHPSGALYDSVCIEGEQIEAGDQLTAFNAALALAGLFNDVFQDQSLQDLNPVSLNPPAGQACSPPWPNGTVLLAARKEGEPSHLYRLEPGGEPVRIDANLPFTDPDELCFAPDGRDGWLYLSAKEGNRRGIWALSADGRMDRLTSDPYGNSYDRLPTVSVARRHLLMLTNRTGVATWRLAEDGLRQGPGIGIALDRPAPIGWSAEHPERLWYRQSDSLIAEYAVDQQQDTGRTATIPVSSDSRGAVSPDGQLLAVRTPSGRVAVYDLGGGLRIEFEAQGLSPTWSGSDTVVFLDAADPTGFYRARVDGSGLERTAVPGRELLSVAAWPGRQ